MDVLATRRRIILALGLLTAVVASYHLAEGDFLLAGLVGATIALATTAYVLDVVPDVLVAGMVAAGYLIGNRGFAQMHAPSFPLLPGEAAIAIGVALVLWRGAQTRRFPVRSDLLNGTVLLWMADGMARMPLDFRDYGFMAVRDFAIVYYAAFFFLAQSWADQPRSRRWLVSCLALGAALCAPVFYVFDHNQEWFGTHLLIASSPLIFVKSDVAGGFMAGATLWFAHRFFATRQRWNLAVSAAAMAGVFVSNSRAAFVAFAFALGWLVVLRAWRILAVLGAFAAIGAVGLVVHAIATPRPFQTTPLYRMYETVASMADVQGTRAYRVAEVRDKPDNNQFRLVWWQTVVADTWHDGRFFGLGFGHDLGADFFRVYYADVSEEFNVRSPHNFLLSIFGRMGLVGSALFIAILVAVARGTVRARATLGAIDSPLPLWLMAWTILVSACFGVVLEGPMAATVFWMSVGLAHAMGSREASVTKAAEVAPAAVTGAC